MNHKYLEDKILGCLSMAAIGDALGMPAHDMTIDEIAERFGGPIRDFHPAQPDSRVHPGYGAAEITDDTLLTLATAKAYIIGQGRIDSETTARLTAEAFEQAKAAGRDRMFGPSTRRAVEALASGQDPVAAALSDQHPAGGASNGAAMKISPVGVGQRRKRGRGRGRRDNRQPAEPPGRGRGRRRRGRGRRSGGGRDSGGRRLHRGPGLPGRGR